MFKAALENQHLIPNPFNPEFETINPFESYMARCHSCSAPLPANSNRCRYCCVRNDVDIQGKLDFSIENDYSQRICPECEIPLQTISVQMQQTLEIERCTTCYGLFFDPGEIQLMLQNSVSDELPTHFQLLGNINRDRYQRQNKIKYLKCPICRVLMNRVNFAKRSGVVIDQCRNHGVWLNNGEITHLMEWKKAGGQQLDNEYNHANSEKADKKSINTANRPQYSWQSKPVEDDLLDSVSAVLDKLFSAE